MTFRSRNEQGGITQGMAITLAIVFFALMAGCIAISVNDDDEDGMRRPGQVGGVKTELAHRSRRCHDGYSSRRRCGHDHRRGSGCVVRYYVGSIGADFLCSSYGRA